jgi:hypothetical protein
MTAEQLKEIKLDITDKIMHEIIFLAYNGKHAWTGVVYQDRYRIMKYFADKGFKLSPGFAKDKIEFPMSPVLTISW